MLTFDTRQKLFLLLFAVFLVSLLLGDMTGSKLFEAHVLGVSIRQSVGIIPFPITFLLTDLLNEFYGRRAARVVTWLGFFMSLFAFAIIAVSVLLPWDARTLAADWPGTTQPAFDQVFAGSQRILAASMVAYLVAQFTDIAIFNRLKHATGGRALWLRATGSTLVSQLIDTGIIQVLAWWGTMPPGDIFGLVVTSYVSKMIVAIGVTPIIYAGHSVLERGLGLHPIRLDAQGEDLQPEAVMPPSA